MSLFETAANRYVGYTESASTCIRALALATVGVAWLFLDTGGTDPTKALGLAHHHRWLEFAVAFAILSLLLDAVQYLVGAYLYQLLSLTIETVFQHPDRVPDPKRRDQAWQHASDIGLVMRILTAADPAATPGDSTTGIQQAQNIVRDLHDDTKAGEPAVVSVKNMTTQTWSPAGYVSATQKLFWWKSGAAAAGGVCLLVFCILAIF